jgi:palmitoyl-protein thioesterase
MGSRLVEYEKNIRWLRLAYPGIYVKNMNIYPGPPSQMTLMAPQMARVQQAIRADPMMKDGFNFYGESQGGLIARAYVSEFNAPPVYNLVAISGPQSGVGLCPEVDMPVIKQICSGGAPIIGVYDWPRCSFCDFWKGKNKKEYISHSRWLRKINNYGGKVDPQKAERMKSLNMYMASAGSDDKVVQPRESAWHTFYAWGKPRTNVMLLNETDGYKGDWLGLRTLQEQGKLILNMYTGGHTKYQEDWWLQNVLQMFNNTL